MGRKKTTRAKSSPLSQVIGTIEKQATSPFGLSLLRSYAPRLLSVLTPIGIAVCSFLGIVPGCKTTPSGPLPEIRQSIRPGVPPGPDTEVAKTDPAKTDPAKADPTGKGPYQLTVGKGSGAVGKEIIYCSWNVENFFDDHDDNRGGAGDKEYDPWYPKNPQILQLKLQKMTEAILSINGGKGPDILAICEVESIRAAQLLQGALNAKLPDPQLHYNTLVMKEMSSGRHIAPAVLTRLPVNNSRTRVLGSRQRILQVHVLAGDRELIVIMSHWTSRLQDGSDNRMGYANTIYGACNAIYLANPKADIIVSGDFNDNPTDISITKGLHSTADPKEAIGSAGSLRLFNLFGNWTPASGGSLFYSGWHQFDQILISPGMLDNYAWSCDVSSVRTINTLFKPGDNNRRPWRFGGPKDTGPRGYSDHYPVAVRLMVN